MSISRCFDGRCAALVAMVALGAGISGCQSDDEAVQLHGQVRLTLLHTSDIHSRLFPYDLQILQSDAVLGLGAPDSVTTVGGAAQVSYLLRRERARAARVLHLDSGDVFQGAPVFNFYKGEAEAKYMANVGVDAMVVGNHEFDLGALNVGQQFQNWGSFPLLAANYITDDYRIDGTPMLGRVLHPFTVLDADGLRVGVIGMGDLSSMTSLFEKPNRLGLQALNTVEAAQGYIDLIRPYVDMIVILSHLGINEDIKLVEGTTGVDVVLGGHNHIVLQPPKVMADCAKEDEAGNHYIELADTKSLDEGETSTSRRYCLPRKVLIAHSGAFAKYVGRLDLVVSDNPVDYGAGYDKVNGFEVLSHEYQLFPVTQDVAVDPFMVTMLEEYKQGLDNLLDLDLLIGYAPDGARRASPDGGDSPLGNMVAQAALLRVGIQTDFSLTNTLGIRADMVPGPVSIEQIFNIFPFENSITKMQLSGVEVQDMFDFVARRSGGRGCKSQAQIAGARVIINCGACTRPDKVDDTCTKDADCEGGGCDEATGRCEAPPCAERIYIGQYTRQNAEGKEVPVPCNADTDCPGGQEGSCGFDHNGKGGCWIPLNLVSSYELATSSYLAQGGSGFRVLQRNTTQVDTKLQQRDALTDFVAGGKPCGYFGPDETGVNGVPDGKPDWEGMLPCRVDTDCAALGDFVCGCPEAVTEDGNGMCLTTGQCASGLCVARACRDEVAEFHRNTCKESATDRMKYECEKGLSACQPAGEVCKFLSCIDERVGNYSDGRLKMRGQ